MSNAEIQRKELPKNLVLQPYHYYVFTEDVVFLIEKHPNIHTNQLFYADIPSMNDDFGVLAIVSGDSFLIDKAVFDEKWHAPFLIDLDGISLEKINLQVSGENQNNWFSASESVGFSSPTYSNSAIYTSVFGSFSLSQNHISPDGDGFEDFTQLHYESVKIGTLISVSIYDKNGFLIDEPFKNYSISDSGDLLINGKRNDAQVLPMGIYVLMIETIDNEGKTFKKKLSLTVNQRF
jgi:hypothetical protein